MAEYIYSKFKEELWSTDFTTHTIKCVLVNLGASNANVPAKDATAPAYADITTPNKGGSGGVPITQQLPYSAPFEGGVFDTTDPSTTFSAVSPTGGTAASCDGIAIYSDTHASKRLMAIIEIGSTINFTNGNVVVTWDNSTSMNGQTGGIFAL